MPENRWVNLPALDPQRIKALQQFLTLQECHLTSCVWWKNQAPWVLKRRICRDSFILLPFVGGFEASLDEGTYEVRPGQFLMIPENKPHALRILSGERHLLQVSIHCDIHDRWHVPFIGWFQDPIGGLSDWRGWKQKLLRLSSLMDSDPDTGRAWGEVLLRELLAEQLWTKTSYFVPERTADPRVESMIRRIKEEASSPLLSVEELAREVGLTPVQMRKLFRRETWESPKSFLMRLRMRRAEYLLRHSAMRIKEVAYSSGFASDHYFHLRFKKIFGVTPEQYRQRVEEHGPAL